MYRLIDAQSYRGEKILVIGGGDSAAERGATEDVVDDFIDRDWHQWCHGFRWHHAGRRKVDDELVHGSKSFRSGLGLVIPQSVVTDVVSILWDSLSGGA